MSRSLRQFSDDLKRLPRVVAFKVAERAAPVITALAKETFDASETPEGKAWAPGKKGQTITLRKTGALERWIKYVAIGSKIRVSLGVPYSKFQIGKRPVFPRQAGDLPETYQQALRRIAVQVVKEEMHQ
jgi:hypothetical protein